MRMDKYGRELDLIVLLTDGGNYTAQQIADRLGITRRNLYYYFDYLRECGFSLIKSGLCYRLDRSSPFFRKLHENIALTEDEAAYICRMLDNTGNNGATARAVRAKIARSFYLADTSDPELLRRVNAIMATLKDAMARRLMVVLHNYSSPHSHSVADRIVEPFLLMNDGREVRCHEIRSHENKTFKLSRMESVEIIDVPWISEAEHRPVYNDVFMFSGEQRHRVELVLGQLSHNLMLEEYPMSADCLAPDGPSRWRFTADVASFLGVGRFVMGLYDDIEIIGGDDFRAYIASKVAGMKAR